MNATTNDDSARSDAPAGSSGAPAWPRRFALATFWLTLVLVLVGSQVTTTAAGMAVKGWIMAEGSDGTYHFMPFFPLAEWFRDHPTMWEHTHRMLGVLVGLGAIATVVAAHRAKLGRGAIVACWVALVAIVIQGAIGGIRVELNAPGLALLHGVTAHATLALIAGAVLTCSPRWQSAATGGVANTSGPRDVAFITTLAILGQVALGAWHRHGQRNPEFDAFAGALHIHMTGAFLVFGLVVFLAVRVGLFANRLSEAGVDAATLAPLAKGKTRMHALIGTQIVLGFAAWMAYGDPDRISAAEQLLAAAHVLVAALLVCQSLVLGLWIARLGAGRGGPASDAGGAA